MHAVALHYQSVQSHPWLRLALAVRNFLSGGISFPQDLLNGSVRQQVPAQLSRRPSPSSIVSAGSNEVPYLLQPTQIAIPDVINNDAPSGSTTNVDSITMLTIFTEMVQAMTPLPSSQLLGLAENITMLYSFDVPENDTATENIITLFTIAAILNDSQLKQDTVASTASFTIPPIVSLIQQVNNDSTGAESISQLPVFNNILAGNPESVPLYQPLSYINSAQIKTILQGSTRPEAISTQESLKESVVAPEQIIITMPSAPIADQVKEVLLQLLFTANAIN